MEDEQRFWVVREYAETFLFGDDLDWFAATPVEAVQKVTAMKLRGNYGCLALEEISREAYERRPNISQPASVH